MNTVDNELKKITLNQHNLFIAWVIELKTKEVIIIILIATTSL